MGYNSFMGWIIFYAFLIFLGNAIWRIQRHHNPSHPHSITGIHAFAVFMASAFVICGFAGLYFSVGILSATVLFIIAIFLTSIIH
jgi:hypothetical protein